MEVKANMDNSIFVNYFVVLTYRVSRQVYLVTRYNNRKLDSIESFAKPGATPICFPTC